MTKRDYIVTNTVQIKPIVSDVISHDIFKRNGKYVFVYPKEAITKLFLQTATIGEAIAYAVTN
ncbi:MAG: hypothetical protein ACWGHH_06455 [Sulfurovaceae bacterium]